MKCSRSQMLTRCKLFITVNNLKTELLDQNMYVFLTFLSISQCPPERWCHLVFLVDEFSA